MIGVGNTMVGASTYGYPYPKYPEGAGPSVPANALFASRYGALGYYRPRSA